LTKKSTSARPPRSKITGRMAAPSYRLDTAFSTRTAPCPASPVTSVRLHDLPIDEYELLMAISHQLGRELTTHFGGYKLNVAAIGNVVRQLQLHHVVRHTDDAAWPAPVWGWARQISTVTLSLNPCCRTCALHCR